MIYDFPLENISYLHINLPQFNVINVHVYQIPSPYPNPQNLIAVSLSRLWSTLSDHITLTTPKIHRISIYVPSSYQIPTKSHWSFLLPTLRKKSISLHVHTSFPCPRQTKPLPYLKLTKFYFMSPSPTPNLKIFTIYCISHPLTQNHWTSIRAHPYTTSNRNIHMC